MIPPLTTDQYAALKASIEQDGVLVPALLQRSTKRVIDGTHRLAICVELGIECPTEYVDVDDAEAERRGLVLNIARRQLTDEQWRQMRDDLIEQYLPPAQEAATKRMSQGGQTAGRGRNRGAPRGAPLSKDVESSRPKSDNAPKRRSVDVVAEQVNQALAGTGKRVSGRTVGRVAAKKGLTNPAPPKKKPASSTPTRAIKRASRVMEDLNDPAVRKEVQALAADSKADRQARAAVQRLERELAAIEADEQKRVAQREKEHLKLLEANATHISTSIKTWDALTAAIITAHKILRAYRFAIKDLPPYKDVWLRQANREMTNLRKELEWLSKELNPNGPEPENAVRRGSVIDATAS